ncbi:ArsR/SmtB family transcription factor [Nocardioides sp.]|uniref:ArsR/SmtB family transcription factor n=1 Tax=Nocardioides sp. TaxID=35761 RepID=UPI00356AB6FC
MAVSKPIELITATQAAQVEESLGLLSAVADPVRWTVLHHLAQHGETCVCDLQERVPVAANLLSYHLKVLREAGLVTTARRGRWVDYTLAEGAGDRLLAALPVTGDRGRP